MVSAPDDPPTLAALPTAPPLPRDISSVAKVRGPLLYGRVVWLELSRRVSFVGLLAYKHIICFDKMAPDRRRGGEGGGRRQTPYKDGG